MKTAGETIDRVTGAEIADEWSGGCTIHSAQRLSSAPGRSYYVEEGNGLVAVCIPDSAETLAPFNYAATKDRTNVQPRPAWVD